jgi:hypothetical protein
MFYRLYKKSDFEQKVATILTEFKKDKVVVVLNQQVNYQDKIVSFATVGKSITNQNVKDWQEKLNELGYSDVSFEITQSVENLETLNMLEKLESTYFTAQQILNKKEEQIIKQEKELIDLQKQVNQAEKSNFPFNQIAKEIKINYNAVTEIAFSSVIKTNFETTDTIPTIFLKWDPKTATNSIQADEAKIQKWLQLKLQNAKLKVSKLN